MKQMKKVQVLFPFNFQINLQVKLYVYLTIINTSQSTRINQPVYAEENLKQELN